MDMKRKLPLLILCLLFLAMVGYFGTHFFSSWKEYRESERTYDNLSQFVHIEESAAVPTEKMVEIKPAAEAEEAPEPSSATAAEETDTIDWPQVDYEPLLALNSDVVGWIYMEDSPINYPLLQGKDNEQYVKKLADGSYNSAGSIFMDYRNEPDLSDRHTVIYGHRMNNGSMFGTIVNYKDQSYFESHPRCMLLTPRGNYTVEFFAGYVAELNDQAWKLEFGSDEEFAEWIEEAAEKSTFESFISPTANDRIVTLSTCTRDNGYTRYVLLGVLR